MKGMVKIMENNIVKSLIKGVACSMLAIAVSVAGIPFSNMTGHNETVPMVAEAATVTGKVPLVTYTRYTSSNLNTYATSALTTKTGYICPYDKCTILKIYSNGAVQVRYPVKNGTRVAYALMSGFFLNSSFSTAVIKLGVGKTAYRKSTGNAAIGSVYANDYVTIIGTENGRTELIYPTSSGYKLGWVSGVYRVPNNNGDSGIITIPQTAIVSNDSVASNMVSYELSQLGIGDTKGNNNVKYNTWYWGRVINSSGYAWCMAFQAYCCNHVTGSNKAIPKTASCTSAVNIYKNRGQFQYSKYYGGNYMPKAGDLVFYTTNGGNTSCHVGMIIGSPVNGCLQTVEGNIKCSDGNWKVVKFTCNSKRTVSNSYVLGYATPNY